MKKFIVLILLLFGTEVKSQWINHSLYSGFSAEFIEFINENTGYIQIDTLNFRSVLHKTTNCGINWTTTRTRYRNYTSNNHTSIVNDSTLIWSCYDSVSTACLIKTTNSGSNWNILKVYPIDWDILAIFFVNENTGWISGRQNSPTIAKVWRTTNGGITFEEQLSDPNNPSFSNLYFLKESVNGYYYGFAINSSGQAKLTTNSGMNWSDYHSFPVFANKIQFFNSNTGFVCNETNPPTLYKTTNGGINWLSIILPINTTFVRRTIKDFSISDPAGLIYCVGGEVNFSNGLTGIIWKSTNGGLNWGIQYFSENNYAQYAWRVGFANANTGFVSCNAGKILKTTNGGGSSVIISISENETNVNKEFSLKQNYPNPFNPSTHINYELRNSNYVSLKVFDLLGKEVAALVNQKQNAGSYAVDFNSGEFNLPSGIYFYTLNAGEFKETKKMVLVK